MTLLRKKKEDNNNVGIVITADIRAVVMNTVDLGAMNNDHILIEKTNSFKVHQKMRMRSTFLMTANQCVDRNRKRVTKGLTQKGNFITRTAKTTYKR